MRTHINDETVAVRLTEVEAYDGPNDPASHAFNGVTDRNRPMFERAGTVYVYLSYGIHWCMNIVVGAERHPSAVLLRGGTVVDGRTIAEARRGRPDHLADGPGKLGQALAVDGDVSGTVLGSVVHLAEGSPRPDEHIVATPRIGISRAVERPWRFVLERTPPARG